MGRGYNNIRDQIHWPPKAADKAEGQKAAAFKCFYIINLKQFLVYGILFLKGHP